MRIRELSGAEHRMYESRAARLSQAVAIALPTIIQHEVQGDVVRIGAEWDSEENSYIVFLYIEGGDHEA